jgi:hypothetical protein
MNALTVIWGYSIGQELPCAKTKFFRVYCEDVFTTKWFMILRSPTEYEK